MLSSSLGSASRSDHLWMPRGKNDIYEWLSLNLSDDNVCFSWYMMLVYQAVISWLFLSVIFHVSICRAQSLTCKRCGCNQSSFLRCAEASNKDRKHLEYPSSENCLWSWCRETAANWAYILVLFFFYWEYMLILTLFPVFPGAKYFESWLEVWGPSLVVQWWWQNSKNHMVIHHEKHLFLHLLTHLFFMTACMR